MSAHSTAWSPPHDGKAACGDGVQSPANSRLGLVNERDLPVLLTPEQLTAFVLQIDYDETHLAHLRRHGGLPYVQFQLNGRRVFRYPRDAVISWLQARTHGVKPTSHGK